MLIGWCPSVIRLVAAALTEFSASLFKIDKEKMEVLCFSVTREQPTASLAATYILYFPCQVFSRCDRLIKMSHPLAPWAN